MTPAQIAQRILSDLGQLRAGRDHRPLPLRDLEPLAREYLRITGPRADSRLSLAGPYLVSLAAAREFGAVTRSDDERARRELTVRLHSAARSADDRWRSRIGEWDVTARTTVEPTAAGSVLVVVSTTTRPNNRG